MLEFARQDFAPSGIPLIPSLSWGSHIGQLYSVGTDLRDVLVPYFRAGLENNERCLWVTDAPLGADDARAALRAAVPDLETRERRGQIEIQDTRTFYDPDEPLHTEAIVNGLLQREQEALVAGYRGLRTNGNCGWVDKTRWNSMTGYESHVQNAVPGRRLICMCSYCHDRIGPEEVSDILERHHFVLPNPRLYSGHQTTLKDSTARKSAGLTIGSSHFDFQDDLDSMRALSAAPTILKTVCRLTGMGFVTIARVTPDRWVCLAVHDGIGFGLKPGVELPVAATLCHEVRQARQALVNHGGENATYGNHHAHSMYGFQTYISVPIFLRDGSFYGTLSAIDPKPAQLDNPTLIGVFRMLADLIAYQLEAATRRRLLSQI